MKRYNKFYNVSLGNFLKVACCSLSIITIASCAEEPFEEDDSSDDRGDDLGGGKRHTEAAAHMPCAAAGQNILHNEHDKGKQNERMRDEIQK